MTEPAQRRTVNNGCVCSHVDEATTQLRDTGKTFSGAQGIIEATAHVHNKARNRLCARVVTSIVLRFPDRLSGLLQLPIVTAKPIRSREAEDVLLSSAKRVNTSAYTVTRAVFLATSRETSPPG